VVALRILIFGFAMWACCVQGQTANVPSTEEMRKVVSDPKNSGSYRFVGNTLVCISNFPAGAVLPSDPDLYYCLKIGQLKIGMSLDDVTSRLGAPQQDIRQSNGVTASMFVVLRTTSRSAYWVVSHKDGKVVAIQLTGTAVPVDAKLSTADYEFSGITLLAPEGKVRELLGPRFSESPVPQIQGTQWNYAPFPFSIQMQDGKVYSIRIHQP
jgi:hypothetical protein